MLLRPADLGLVDGPPEGRRRWLDELLARISHGYARALGDYHRVLRQRNELLRGSARAAAPVRESWDDALVASGVPLVVARAAVAGRLGDRFDAVAGAVASPEGRAGYGLEYRPSVGVGPDETTEPERIAPAWRAALEGNYARDRARGWTSVGPHRDDVALALAGRPLDRFGSQGERRTAAIALRLMEAELLEEDTGHRPILLLDDVLTELDAHRAGRLLAWLGDRHQRFITSPRPLPEVDGELERWGVENGRIVPGRAR